ncbi:tRNA uridine-5-carboxymethylaminomethyl(34) synthesis GTPase MnmE [Athalassotoga saccharophila]|uniref:tRNA uridine-5-carboxymethylaminomethyl(34) synthesis GTPase MnmE n=1 Tax=Athalassotoga saccharophila TaxID=1441386 RepID=UPI001379A2BF|nr:tRNA uridine-5-carboxymethylaminomethyl(34) synthesis GTPase MnmE [Athalassotoga saccharophila]BBJ28958.1 tRNA modification GTPase MnmE [Athalassotoga saccharophila]
MVMNDTIVAISTPYGKSAVGMIRISGPKTLEIIKKHLKASIKPRMAIHSNFEVEGKVLDDVIFVFYKGPHTYTGEDMAEIFFHGNWLILSNAMKALIDSGSRVAEKGEFTKRAFLNGKMDLTQAEAVEELIDSTSMVGVENTRKVLEGNLNAEILKVREKLLEISSEIEVRIDYPEEFEETSEYNFDLKDVIGKLEGMLSTYNPAKAAIDGIKVALFGSTNVGKSSILNALVGFERAIVTPVPGTTRDTVEGEIFINGLKVKIIDTAGIRETNDEIEKIGINRTMETVKNADVKVYIVDATVDYEELPVIEPDIKVINKVDLVDRNREGFIKVSARTGYGIEDLKSEIEKISRKYIEKLDSSSSVIVAQRQYSLVKECLEEIKEASRNKEMGYTPDIIAINIRNAIEKIDLLTGRVYVDDLLDRIFSNFCVGK